MYKPLISAVSMGDGLENVSSKNMGGKKYGRKSMGEQGMEALMCLFGIAIGGGLVIGLWLVAKFAARNIDGEYDE